MAAGSANGSAERSQVAPAEIDASAEEALKAQLVIEAAIESWQTGRVVTL